MTGSADLWIVGAFWFHYWQQFWLQFWASSLAAHRAAHLGAHLGAKAGREAGRPQLYMIVSDVYDHAARLRSFEFIANVAGSAIGPGPT